MLRAATILSLLFLFSASAEEHWAYARMADPAISGSSLERPVDHFIDAKLERAELKPAAPAAPHALIRRLSFNLTGLPPEPEAIEAFCAAHATDPERAIATATAELLASPHYGERQARLWLDVARYADSNGQDENKAMANAWRYRDWVVDAFNADMAYDEFVRRQLAGDLQEEPDPTGTGFLVLGPKRLAEQDKEKMVFDIIDEQIDTMGRAFLASTLGCARCHDHKTDPVSQRDYFALAGIFQSTKTMANRDFVSKWNETDVSTEAERRARKAAENKRDALHAELLAARREADENLRHRIAADAALYRDAALGADAAAGLVEPVLKRWRAEAERLGDLTAEQLLAARDLPESSLVAGVQGGAFHGKEGRFVDVAHRSDLEPAAITLSAWVRLRQVKNGGENRRWIVNKNANEWEVGHYSLVVDGKQIGAYIAPEGGRENVVRAFGGDMKVLTWHHVAMADNGKALRVYLDGKQVAKADSRPRQTAKGHLRIGGRADGFNAFETGDIDEVRIYGRSLTPQEVKAIAEGKPTGDGLVQAWSFDPETEAEREALKQSARRELARRLFALPEQTQSHWTPDEQAEIKRLETAHKTAGQEIPELPFVMAVADDRPVTLQIHNRGEHLKPVGDPVPRGVPRDLGVGVTGEVELPLRASGRSELAAWITHPEHPLTARVIVNRVWAQHFGSGLVRSMDNFGPSGEAPTHPELLDWLARDFIRSGWSIKALHRRIVASEAFQRGADHPEAQRIDPENRLLSHVPRRRLEAEMLRDSVLAIAGTLDRTRGGSLVAYKNHDYVPKSKSPVFDSKRRALYLPIIRDRVYSLFDLFDLPEPSASNSKRDSTVLPHQALFFFNSPLVREGGKAFAQRVAEMAEGRNARIDLAHRLAFGRPATPAEQALATSFLDGGADWPAYCQALFASNEFLFLD